jgi:hypothetical protein
MCCDYFAMAYVRVAARESDPADKQAWLKEAFAQAEKSLASLSDEFRMDLSLEFVREAGQLDPERARQFSAALIALVLAAKRDWMAHRLFDLDGCGYVFSANERTAIERLSDQWVDKLEHLKDGSVKGEPLSEEHAHSLASEHLTHVARSVLPVNRAPGLQLITRAARHAEMVSEPSNRLQLRCGILRCLLMLGQMDLWQEAVIRSLDYGEAIFRTFDRFGYTLLALRAEDSALPLRLLETIEWAEQLMRV